MAVTLHDVVPSFSDSMETNQTSLINYDPASLSMTRRVLDEIGVTPNRTMGQNFLVNGDVLDRIVRTGDVEHSNEILEIGPGLGSLTCRLLQSAGRVTAIEKDRILLSLVNQKLPAPNLHLVEADALRVGWEELRLSETGVKVVANLPYSISKPMLRRLLEEWRPHFTTLTLLVQREVADRIVAAPATPAYGPMAIMTRLHGEARRVFDVKPGSFWPPPAVTSSVVHIKVRQTPRIYLRDESFFWRTVNAAFSQRRKQLINTLRGIQSDREALAAALRECDIDPQRRGETLALEEFAHLAERLKSA